MVTYFALFSTMILFTSCMKFDEDATRNITGTYRFSFANTYMGYNNQANAIITEWTAENDYCIKIDVSGYLTITKEDQILFEGWINNIEDNGLYQAVDFENKDVSLHLTLRDGQLSIADFPINSMAGNESDYGNFFFKEVSDHCISCQQSDAFQGTYIGNMVVENYNNVVIDSYPDTVIVVAENSDMGCKLRVTGLFEGLYYLNSALQLVENIPAEGMYFIGDTLHYGKYYNGTGPNYDYCFKGVRQQ